MNDLSWLLYFADVCGSVSRIGLMLAFLAFGVGLFAGHDAAYVIERNYSYGVRKKRIFKSAWTAGKRFFIAASIIITVITFIPSKTTIYAIAASEMGEEALKSKTAGKAMQALDAWLDKQIHAVKKPEKGE